MISILKLLYNLNISYKFKFNLDDFIISRRAALQRPVRQLWRPAKPQLATKPEQLRAEHRSVGPRSRAYNADLVLGCSELPEKSTWSTQSILGGETGEV